MRLISLMDIDLPGNMFDGIVDSQTVAANEISTTFPVAGFNAVTVLNNYGLEASLEVDGVTQTVSLTRDSIKDWWDYWFAPFRIGRDCVFYFPVQPADAQATLTISYPGGDAKCGLCVTGFAREIAKTINDVSIGISDYSRIITNDFGETFLNPGRWAKRGEVALFVENHLSDIAFREIVNNRARPCVFDYNEYATGLDQFHTSVSGLQSLIVYGFTEDYVPSISGPVTTDARHEVQGLT